MSWSWSWFTDPMVSYPPGAMATVLLLHSNRGILPRMRLQKRPSRRSQGSKWIRRSTRASIYLRDSLLCFHCGATCSGDVVATLDHIVPYTSGSGAITSDPTQIVVACKPCNSSRKDTPLSPTDLQRATRQALRPLDRRQGLAIVNQASSWGAALLTLATLVASKG